MSRGGIQEGERRQRGLGQRILALPIPVLMVGTAVAFVGGLAALWGLGHVVDLATVWIGVESGAFAAMIARVWGNPAMSREFPHWMCAWNPRHVLRRTTAYGVAVMAGLLLLGGVAHAMGNPSVLGGLALGTACLRGAGVIASFVVTTGVAARIVKDRPDWAHHLHGGRAFGDR